MESTTPVVLVAEDEPDLANVYARWLSAAYSVETALDGEEAISKLDSTIDVVLLDRRMPGLTGDEVLKRVRERGFECRVAMVTAVDPGFDIVEMGFDDYLEKPVAREELLTTVERLVSLSTYDREVRELFSLASKKAALEAEKTPEELAGSDEYGRLQQRFVDLGDRVDGAIGDVGEAGYRALFRDLDGGWSGD